MLHVKIVFEDWRKHGVLQSIYNTEEGLRLSTGQLHSGTTFRALVELPFDPEQEREIEDALAEGYCPVFRVIQE